MFDPKSPFNDARLSEITADPAEHEHLDAWLAHLQGYEKIQRGPYQSTHGLNHNGWSAQHPKQTRRVAVPNYTGDYNILMQFLLETQTAVAAGGIIDMFHYEEGDPITNLDLIHGARYELYGPDNKNRWTSCWTVIHDDPIRIHHFEPPVAIAASIIIALEGQRAAYIQPNTFEKTLLGAKASFTQHAAVSQSNVVDFVAPSSSSPSPAESPSCSSCLRGEKGN